jgi:tetratricopeptide (TPR) repeat protein
MRGKALYRAGRTREAYETYKAAWNLRKAYEIAGNLGNVALELGRPREAAEYFAYSRSLFPEQGSPEKLAVIEAGLAEARSQVATVRVEVRRSGNADDGGIADAEVLGDERGVRRAPLGRELFLDPGQYTLRARLLGYADGERVIQAKKGATSKATAEPAREWRLPVIAAGFSVATVGLGLGIGAAVHAGARHTAKNEEWIKLYDAAGESACYAGGGPRGASCDELFAAERDERTFRALSVASFIVGGAGAATSIALLFLVERSSALESRGQSAMSLSIGLVPGAVAASVKGSF